MFDLAKTVQPYTMASPERVQLLISLAARVIEDKIPGDFVECGVCNGGSAAILAHYAGVDHPVRRTHLFDSWLGLPATTPEDTASANGNTAESEIGKCVGDPNTVDEVMRKVGADTDEVIYYVGWFQDTFPKAVNHIEQIAMLNLDSDWYSSEKLCLEAWYDKVSNGGFIYFDDFYYWPGCQKAALEFFNNRQIVQIFHQVGHSAWMKKGEIIE